MDKTEKERKEKERREKERREKERKEEERREKERRENEGRENEGRGFEIIDNKAREFEIMENERREKMKKKCIKEFKAMKNYGSKDEFLMESEYREDRDNYREMKERENIETEVTNFIDSKLDGIRDIMITEMRQNFPKNNINEYLSYSSLKAKLIPYPEQRIRMIYNEDELCFDEPPLSIDIKILSVGNTNVFKYRVMVKCVEEKSDYKVNSCVIDVDLEKNIKYMITLQVLNNKDILKKWEENIEQFKLVLKAVQIEEIEPMKEALCSDETEFLINISKKEACINHLENLFNIKKRFPMSVIQSEVTAANNNAEQALNRLLQYEMKQ